MGIQIVYTTPRNAVRTQEVPLVAFSGDYVIPAGTTLSLTGLDLMGGRCTGFVLASIVGTVQASINGGGYRTIPSAISVDLADIQSLSVTTGAASSAILQLHGV
jgi:hypothetical protein